jgi:hypothetical protein
LKITTKSLADIGFVIDDIFIKSNILPDRERELDAIQYLIETNQKVVRPEEVHRRW